MDEKDDDDIHGMSFYLRTSGHKIDAKTKLDKYLNEDCEPFIKLVNFDILNWWKVNSTRFPMLGSMASEVLAILVSTIASKSSFNAGGRILDPYQSSLTPRMVKVLVCTQDWLKETSFQCLLIKTFKSSRNLSKVS